MDLEKELGGMSKKKITVRVGSTFRPKASWGSNYVGGLQPDLYYVRVDELIETLLSYKKDYPEYEDLRIEKEEEYGETIHVLTGTRLETDKEYEWRVSQEKRTEQEQLDRDRKEYEKLRAKFERE